MFLFYVLCTFFMEAVGANDGIPFLLVVNFRSSVRLLPANMPYIHLMDGGLINETIGDLGLDMEVEMTLKVSVECMRDVNWFTHRDKRPKEFKLQNVVPKYHRKWMYAAELEDELSKWFATGRAYDLLPPYWLMEIGRYYEQTVYDFIYLQPLEVHSHMGLFKVGGVLLNHAPRDGHVSVPYANIGQLIRRDEWEKEEKKDADSNILIPWMYTAATAVFSYVEYRVLSYFGL